MCTSAVSAAFRVIALVIAATGSGCISRYDDGSRRYEVDLRNTAAQTITVEVLAPGRIRADLGPGGSYVQRFSVSNHEIRPEARFRPFPCKEGDPYVAFDLAPGTNKYDLAIAGDRVLFSKRPAPWDTSP